MDRMGLFAEVLFALIIMALVLLQLPLLVVLAAVIGLVIVCGVSVLLLGIVLGYVSMYLARFRRYPEILTGWQHIYLLVCVLFALFGLELGHPYRYGSLAQATIAILGILIGVGIQYFEAVLPEPRRRYR